MTTYFAHHALLPDGWADNVRFHLDADGMISRCEKGARPAAADQQEEVLGIVVPGMPNLHSHAFQRAMAGLTEIVTRPGDSFWSWREQMYAMLDVLEADDVLAIARQLYIDMLKAGYTSVAEFHYLHHSPSGEAYQPHALLAERISQAAQQTGMALTLLPVFYARSGFGKAGTEPGQRRFRHDSQGYLELYRQLTDSLSTRPLQRTGLCFHSLRAVNEQDMADVLGHYQPFTPVHIHIAEQQQEVRDCLAYTGKRPVQWLLDNLPVNEDWCLVHATHLDGAEVEQLAASRAVAGLCITTEANLGDGIFPAVDYLAAGGRFGVGSDSHVSLSVTEEIRWLEYGQRLRDQGRCRLASSDQPAAADRLYQQACQGGAQALGQPVGQLAEGYRADWLVLDDQHPLMAISDDRHRLSRWLFASERNLIRHVMVGGQWAIRDGQHPLEGKAAEDYLHTLRKVAPRA